MAKIHLKSGMYFDVDDSYESIKGKIHNAQLALPNALTYFEFTVNNLGWIDFSQQVKPTILVDILSVESVTP